MKSCLFFILFFLFQTSIAQVRIYQDLNGNIVTQEEFWKLRNEFPNIYANRASNDTLVTFLYKGTRDFKGKLDEVDFLKLQSIYPFKEDNSPIIIQYFPGVDECNAHYISRTDEMITFLVEKNRKIGKGKKKVYNIFKSNSKVEKISDRLGWIKDENAFIENLFFEYHFPCGSYVVINKQGEYKGFKGEYSDSQIIADYNKLN